MKKSLWYEKSYRRHLCDMHIDDWDEEFLSKFSAENYFENLKRANVTTAMLYYQSHVGLCYYPTKTAKMHSAFIGRENEMQKLTNMCRENGISVVGYYSLNYNVWAHDRHPEWRMLMPNGQSKRDTKSTGGESNFETAGGSRYGICCPNVNEYNDFVYKQIDEMLEYFTPDALFFDMLFWPYPCYCNSCKKRWTEETGIPELPTVADFSNPVWRLFCEKRSEWMGEFAQRVTDYVKKKAPHLTVQHNVSAAAKSPYMGTGLKVNAASEFCGGDLSGGLLEESVTCKLYREISMNQPFEYMFPKCEPSLYRHTLVKTDEHIEAAVFLTAAHHGATMVIDAIDPVGTLDERSFESIGRAFKKEAEYEKYFLGDTVADIGVAYGLESKGFGRFKTDASNHTAVVSFIRNMIEAGIGVDVISKPRDLSSYKMIFAPCLWEADVALCDALTDYAKNGGTLFISGAGNEAFIEKLTGAKLHEMIDTSVCYFAPKPEYEKLFMNFNADYPLHVNGSIPKISIPEGSNAKVLATLTMPYTNTKETKFASIHSNPPGIRYDIPTIIETSYGKGTVIYSSAPLENEEYITYQNIVRNFIDKYVGLENLSVRTTAPTNVETVTFRDGDDFYVNNCLLLDPKNAPYMPSFEVRVKTEKEPTSVKLLPSMENIEFTFDGKYTRFTTKESKIFDMYKIEA